MALRTGTRALSSRPSAVAVERSSPAWEAWKVDPHSATPLDSPLARNQGALPMLPVPQMKDTLAKLLSSCRPLARTEEEYAELERKAQDFGQAGGIGEIVQARLVARAGTEGVRNWIAKWWDEDAYMKYRDSVVVNVSYYYGFVRLPQSPPSLPKKVSIDPAYVAASIVTTALEFRRLIIKGLLEPESAGKGQGELCMESFKWAFNACRVPASPSDYAVKVAEDSPDGQHMIVIRNNQFWSVALVDKNGTEFTTEEFRRAFQSIIDRESPVALGVGILTGVNRDSWAEAHMHLIDSSVINATTLATIRTSAFVVALDQATPEPALLPLASSPTSRSSEGIKEFSERLWKAGGATIGAGEGANRWWDKPLQWIVFSNGESGFIGEHSCMDGTPTARMNDFISKRLLTDSPSPVGVGYSSAIIPEVSPLHWQLDAKAQAQIQAATTEFAAATGRYAVHYVNYGRYGKDGIKKMKTSPDGWTQQIFQLAYYMTHAAPCGTYEAASVRRFQLGRTETVRCCTSESLAWSKAMLDPNVSDLDKRELFRTAVGRHGVDMKNASAGLGIDRHLFGLRKLVKDGEVAELLSDPLVARSSTWNMSTSQIFIENSPAYGWGPTATDGYGIPYMIHSDRLQLTVTCGDHMPGAQFIQNLEKAADMLMDMMVRAGEAEGAKL